MNQTQKFLESYYQMTKVVFGDEWTFNSIKGMVKEGKITQMDYNTFMKPHNKIIQRKTILNELKADLLVCKNLKVKDFIKDQIKQINKESDDNNDILELSKKIKEASKPEPDPCRGGYSGMSRRGC
jgi:hypothetical protein